jgi:hypothetical protein
VLCLARVILESLLFCAAINRWMQQPYACLWWLRIGEEPQCVQVESNCLGSLRCSSVKLGHSGKQCSANSMSCPSEKVSPRGGRRKFMHAGRSLASCAISVLRESCFAGCL